MGRVDFYNGTLNVQTVTCEPFVVFVDPSGLLNLERVKHRRFDGHLLSSEVSALIRVLETAQQITLKEAS